MRMPIEPQSDLDYCLSCIDVARQCESVDWADQQRCKAPAGWLYMPDCTLHSSKIASPVSPTLQ